MTTVPMGRSAYTTPLKVDKALAIPGWMSVIEICWLAEQATKHSRIVEIGSYLGRSTRALADNTPGWVLAVDDWLGPRDVGDVPQDVWNKFYYNMCEVGFGFCGVHEPFPKHKVLTYKCDHRTAEPYKIGNELFDMIFIDGSHEYEDVKRDIAKWVPYLEKGGLICGHDFDEPYEGVRRAVWEAFNAKDIVITGTIWAVQR